MIDVQSLGVRFGARRGQVDAVRGVSFHVDTGEAFGIVGESGSGKTTVLRALCGLAPVSAGQVTVGAHTLGGTLPRAFRHDVQMVFQDPYGSLHPRFTVDRTLRVQLEVLGARLEQMEPCSDLKLDQKRRVARIHEILAEHPEYHWMRQYHDDIHHLGYRPIADRIRAETGGEPLTLVGGVGSGASTGALARYLRAGGGAGGTGGAGGPCDVELVGVQPYGSVSFGAEHVSGASAGGEAGAPPAWKGGLSHGHGCRAAR